MVVVYFFRYNLSGVRSHCYISFLKFSGFSQQFCSISGLVTLVNQQWFQQFVFFEDLINYIDTNYRTIPQRESRGIAGHSMGWTGAFKLAMKYPDIYSAIFSLSAGAISFEHVTLSPAYKDYLIQAAIETDASNFDAWNWRKQVMVASVAAFAPVLFSGMQQWALIFIDSFLFPVLGRNRYLCNAFE